MLRLLALLLILLNGVYYAWSHKLLRPYGFAPQQQNEPFRLTQQIRPELVRILSADEARRVEVAAQTAVKPVECLQAGPFDETQTATLRETAQTVLPAGSWLLDAAELRGTLFKIPVVDDALKARLDDLKTALAGKPLRACK